MIRIHIGEDAHIGAEWLDAASIRIPMNGGPVRWRTSRPDKVVVQKIGYATAIVTGRKLGRSRVTATDPASGLKCFTWIEVTRRISSRRSS
jgi:hypothetical protein